MLGDQTAQYATIAEESKAKKSITVHQPISLAASVILISAVCILPLRDK